MTKRCQACLGTFEVHGDGRVACPSCTARFMVVRGVLLTYAEAGRYFGLMMLGIGLLLLAVTML